MQMFSSIVFFPRRLQEKSRTGNDDIDDDNDGKVAKNERKTMKIAVATRSIENPKCIFFECHSSIIQCGKAPDTTTQRTQILHTIQHRVYKYKREMTIWKSTE